VSAECDFLTTRCGSVRGSNYTTADACRANFQENVRRFPLTQGETFAAYLNRLYTLNDAQAQACVALFATSDCATPTNTAAACDAAIEVTNVVANGAVCDGDELRCEDDTALCGIKAGTNTCAVCQPKGPNGNVCGTNDECVSGWCDVGSGYCTAPPTTLAGINQACTLNTDCLGALVCVNNVCRDPVGLNGVCDGPAATVRNNPPCKADLSCVTNNAGVTGTCQAWLADGQTCQRQGRILLTANGNFVLTTAPECAHECVFPTRTSATGTCSSVTALPAVGQPCNKHTPLQCAPRTDLKIDVDFTRLGANEFAESGCSCESLGGTGTRCWGNGDCANGRCTGSDFGAYDGATMMVTDQPSAGTCGPRLANGQACTADDDCATTSFCFDFDVAGVCTGDRGNSGADIRCRADAHCISGFCNGTNPVNGFGSCAALPACP